MKIPTYNGPIILENLKLVKITSTITDHVSYQVRDNNDFDLIDSDHNMVGCWDTKEEIQEYINSREIHKFYHVEYDETDTWRTETPIVEENLPFTFN